MGGEDRKMDTDTVTAVPNNPPPSHRPPPIPATQETRRSPFDPSGMLSSPVPAAAAELPRADGVEPVRQRSPHHAHPPTCTVYTHLCVHRCPPRRAAVPVEPPLVRTADGPRPRGHCSAVMPAHGDYIFGLMNSVPVSRSSFLRFSRC